MKLLPTLLILGCAATLISVANAQKSKPAVKMHIPRVESADLNGKPFVLPDDFTSPRTLLLIAFQREHQDLIDGWVAGLALKSTDKDWFELPTVGAMGFMGQKFLDGAMRSGIRGEDKRSRVVTLYIDPKKFIAPLGKTKTDTIYIAVVAKNGEVLALSEGAFDKNKAAKIKDSWRVEAK